MAPTELRRFYEGLVQQLRERGVICAITSGLACVHYGVAETTKDCDLLCHPGSLGDLLELLSATSVQGVACRYQGNLSPPLDARWHQGGWTSHFEWDAASERVTLDVFGHGPRESSPWPRELLGLYAGPETVAEMKRTRRDKDWAAVTALGLRMIEAGDERGWLHIFSAETLAQLLRENPCPPELAKRRPALALALKGDPRTPGALQAERRLWEELDRRRIQLLEQPLRPYAAAVRRGRPDRDLSLRQEHELRLACATQHLPTNPLKEYGLERYLDEARRALAESGLVPAEGLAWLPEVGPYFAWLDR